MKESLKVGLILNGLVIPLWIYRVMEKIVATDFATVSLIILLEPEEGKNVKMPAFYKLHEKLDRLIFRNRIDYFHPVNLWEKFTQVPVIPFHFDPHDLKVEFDEIQPDVILNFDADSSAKKWGKYVRYGVWTYMPLPVHSHSTPACCYWETVKTEPVISVGVTYTDGNSEKKEIIHQSWLSANYNSFHINQNNAYGSAPFIFSHLLEGVYKFGKDYLLRRAEKFRSMCKINNNELSELSLPKNAQAVRNMHILLFRYLSRKLVYKSQFRWFLMVNRSRNPLSLDPDKFVLLNPPKDRFWADPFVLSRNEKYDVFAEEFVYRKNKGHIVWFELDHTGNLLHTEKILERPYHMSYPFVFEHDGQYYMIPETSENRTVELYKSTDFPVKWEFVMNLMENCNAVDSTLFYHGNKWWLFTSVNEFTRFPDHRELFLYYSDNLFSNQWKPHPGNPVVTDVRTARPGGKIFTHNGKIYRPSQDCSVRYGRALNFNEITRLTEDDYSERMVKKWEPTWFPHLQGVHTFNFDKNITLIDGYTFRKRIGLSFKNN